MEQPSGFMTGFAGKTANVFSLQLFASRTMVMEPVDVSDAFAWVLTRAIKAATTRGFLRYFNALLTLENIS